MVLIVETKGLNGSDLADFLSFVQGQLRKGFVCGEGWYFKTDYKNE